MTRAGEGLQICERCQIHHYENCGSCFGFGVYESQRGNGLVPISASEAHDLRPPGEPLPCPECKSTINGVPL